MNMFCGSFHESNDLENENEEYTVEQVVERRMHKGQLEYLVKWKDFPEEDNTWELAKHLECSSLIAEFESQRQQKNRKRQAELERNEFYVAKAKKLKIEPDFIIDNAFDYGHRAEEIVYALNTNDKISFVIKFKDLDQPEMVDAEAAYAHIPQLVLKFYEQHLKLLHAFSTNYSEAHAAMTSK